MPTPDAIVAEARDWLDTPYVHQASLKGIGADCIGLVAGVAAALGLPDALAWERDPRRHSYGTRPDATVLVAAAGDYLERLPGGHFERGYVLLLRFRRDPQHFAIVSEIEPHPYVVHAYASAQRVVENRLDRLWRKRVVAVFRYRDRD